MKSLLILLWEVMDQAEFLVGALVWITSIFGWVYKVKAYVLATQYRKKLESFTPLTVALKAYGSIRIKSTFQGVTG
jgi:hypothetical protein